MSDSTRLLNKFQPKHYNIYLDINRAQKLITGQTTITGDAKVKTIAE